jgi:hypothetical protein
LINHPLKVEHHAQRYIIVRNSYSSGLVTKYNTLSEPYETILVVFEVGSFGDSIFTTWRRSPCADVER